MHESPPPKVATLHGLVIVVGICLVITIVSIVSLTGWSDLRSQRQILNQSFLIPLEPSNNVLITDSKWRNLSLNSGGEAQYGLFSSSFQWDGETLSTVVGSTRLYMGVTSKNALVFVDDKSKACQSLSIVYSNAAQTAYIACARGGADLFLQGTGFLTARPFGRPFRVFS